MLFYAWNYFPPLGKCNKKFSFSLWFYFLIRPEGFRGSAGRAVASSWEPRKSQRKDTNPHSSNAILTARPCLPENPNQSKSPVFTVFQEGCLWAVTWTSKKFLFSAFFFFKPKLFFLMWTIFCLCWICYTVAVVLCFVFFTKKHVGS